MRGGAPDRVAGGLSSAPDSLATNGFFAVSGSGHSAKAGCDVFTWRAGRYLSRGRYTVVGLGAAFAGAPADAAPLVQAGHTNTLSVRTAVPSDGGTLSFAYSPFCAEVSVKNLLTGGYDPLPLLDPVPVSGWLGTYAAAATGEAEVRYAATSAGDHAFGVTYRQDGCTPSSVSTNYAFRAVRIVAEPVCADLAPDGAAYNPSGLAAGADGRFKIALAEGSVPDGDITWTVREGSLSPNGNTGPDVAVHAGAPGAFTLEADVRGLVVTPPHVRPFFSGAVLPAVAVPVTVWIVRDGDGENPARDAAAVPGLLNDANAILRQCGITLEPSGPVRFADNDAWLNPSNTTASAEQVFDELMDSSANTGGLELYFVQTITSMQGDAKGVKRAKGIAIAADGDAATVAHEVLHACGLADIYPKLSQAVFLTEECTPERLPSDWCGGYYEPGKLQRYLVGSLVMSPQYPNVPPRADVPSGPVWGWGAHVVQGAVTYELELVPVGQSAMKPLTPSE